MVEGWRQRDRRGDGDLIGFGRREEGEFLDLVADLAGIFDIAGEEGADAVDFDIEVSTAGVKGTVGMGANEEFDATVFVDLRVKVGESAAKETVGNVEEDVDGGVGVGELGPGGRVVARALEIDAVEVQRRNVGPVGVVRVQWRWGGTFASDGVGWAQWDGMSDGMVDRL